MKLLVTGSNGFVGSALIRRVAGITRYQTVAASRSFSVSLPEKVATLRIGDLRCLGDITPSLRKINTIVHTAGLAHISNMSPEFLNKLHNVNVNGTIDLARQAAVAGVRRFIFISSVKAIGDETQPGKPYTELSPTDPQDPYGKSKCEAEEKLRLLSDETGLQVVIIRPPLVYGPGVKGNFHRLLGLVNSRIPLPLGNVRNQRSLIALDNLVDFIITCMEHPDAANQTFLVSDGEDLSTIELLQRLGRTMDKPVWLIPIPVNILKLGGLLIGKEKEMEQLCGNLQVNITKARETLGWNPPVCIEDGFCRTIELRR